MIDKYYPPDDFSGEAKAIWHSVIPARAKTAERIALIKTALECYDRLNQVKSQLDKEGLMIENPSTGAIRANPLLKLEKELRAQFAQIWGVLGLDWHAVKDGGNSPGKVEIYQPLEGIQANEEALLTYFNSKKED